MSIIIFFLLAFAMLSIASGTRAPNLSATLIVPTPQQNRLLVLLETVVWNGPAPNSSADLAAFNGLVSNALKGTEFEAGVAVAFNQTDSQSPSTMFHSCTTGPGSPRLLSSEMLGEFRRHPPQARAD